MNINPSAIEMDDLFDGDLTPYEMMKYQSIQTSALIDLICLLIPEDKKEYETSILNSYDRNITELMKGDYKIKKMMNIQNRTIYCKDNLDILKGIDSETVDMIYLDPPFNKNTSFHAPIGSNAEGASFKDIFGKEDVRDYWGDYFKHENEELHNFIVAIHDFADISDYSYVAYMAERILECHRILKDTGSLFYHCDDTMQHYIKIMLDIVFGRDNFRNEINWLRGTSHNDGNNFGRITDAILYYAKSDSFKFNNVYIPKDDSYFNYTEKETGRRYSMGPGIEIRNGVKGEIFIDGEYRLPPPGYQWRWSQEYLDNKLAKNPYILHKTSGGRYKYKLYQDEDKGFQVSDNWADIRTKTMKKDEKVGYPTQKPLALLRRIIESTTDEGDFILDPFCGCATACVAAEQLNREWVGIDISQDAYRLVKDRCVKEVEGFDLKTGQYDAFGSQKEIFFKVDAPKRNKEIEKPKSKHIYIIESPAYPGWYKVGIASNMKQRKGAYQTGSPFRDYELKYNTETPLYREIEKSVHNNFENNHEWVKAELQDIIDYIENY